MLLLGCIKWCLIGNYHLLQGTFDEVTLIRYDLIHSLPPGCKDTSFKLRGRVSRGQ